MLFEGNPYRNWATRIAKTNEKFSKKVGIDRDPLFRGCMVLAASGRRQTALEIRCKDN
jgi:hypothetical protein